MRALASVLHRGLVYLITVAVFVQAVLAGQFVSGLSNATGLHGAVAGVLEGLAVLLVVVAIGHWIAGSRSSVALFGSLALAFALECQAILGWMPGQVPTAVHVPLGVCIFAGALGLSIVIGRSVGQAPASSTEHRPS